MGERRATYKREVIASRAVVASNHPLASTAGVEMLTRGGNAVDAAVATLFALSVVEPMMVSPFGAGFFVIRDGRSGAVATIDNYATVPLAATADMFEPVPGSLDYETVGQENDIGYKAVATPGALKGWAHAVARYGRLPLAETIEPAIRYAAGGFAASGYLVQIIADTRDALARFPATAAVFLPGGRPPAVGQRIVRADYARTLRQIAEEGPETLYTGALARVVAADMAANGGLITLEDLAGYQIHEREPVRGDYRGHEIVSMAPPSSGGTHIVQLLNLLEGYDIGRGDLAFGTPAYLHLLAEALKIAFADRRRYMADPERVAVPVALLTSKAYAARRRADIDPARARDQAAGELTEVATFLGGEGANTTHLTVMDDEGTIVSATQTLNSGFGSKVTVPGTGMLLDNCMVLMDPTPGRTNSVEGGKRILSSMSPTLVLRDGAPRMALGTPGGKRIFAAVTQALLNVIDHGMTLQEAVEAPRAWTQGAALELEAGFPDLGALRAALRDRGHDVAVVPKVAGGMNGVLVDEEGLLHGAACWRADGVPIGVSGGPARPSSTSGVPE
ncbi:MAG TPA: gamma-glutamyltransferase [Thermomicrobiales bacterium]|nr:gamma-glutamyltransferase [Thermomicrobiales bacterium]